MKRMAVRTLSFLLAALLLPLVVALLAGLTYAPNTEIPAGFVGRHIDVGGVPIRYHQAGAGRDVLLIHGSSGSIEDWDPIFAQLAKSFRVTAFDRPGHGFSGDVASHSQEQNVRIVAALIKQLKLTDAVLVGHSYGGPIALLTATRMPEKAHSVVVLDSALFEPLRPAAARFRVITTPVLGLGILRMTPSFLLAGQVRAGLLKEYRVKPPSEAFLEQRGEMWSSPKVLHSIADETLGSFQWLPVIKKAYLLLRRPLYVLAQAEDPRRLAQAKLLHNDVPGSTLIAVPRSGHFLHHEQPQRVIDAITRAAQ